jgi:hypothetical protein
MANKCSQARLTLTVAAVNDAPTCQDLAVAGPARSEIMIPASCSDVDGDILSYSVPSGPSSITISVGGGGAITIVGTSPGDYALTYAASDGQGSSTEARIAVHIDPPVTKPLTVNAATILFAPRGGTLGITATTEPTVHDCPSIQLTVNDRAVLDVSTRRVPRTRTCLALTNAGIVVYDQPRGQLTGVIGLPRGLQLPSASVAFGLRVDNEQFATTVTGRRTGNTWSYRR